VTAPSETFFAMARAGFRKLVTTRGYLG